MEGNVSFVGRKKKTKKKLKLQYTEKMSRFRWSSLYSPTNKSKLAFKF